MQNKRSTEIKDKVKWGPYLIELNWILAKNI